MGDMRGFIKIKRQEGEYRPIRERVKDYRDVAIKRSDDSSIQQSSRCMDCGTPFCHGACPLGNYIPEWNDLVFHGQWKRALDLLQATNNLPEISGRLCPALCEYACVLGINDDAVTIRENELALIEHGFKNGYIKPRVPEVRTGKKIAIIGSGPSGLACADQLNKAGHNVTVFERDDEIGGIVRYGIPDFKLEKSILDRRIAIFKKEGIEFKTNTEVGSDYAVSKLKKSFDAIVLAGGSREPRDLKIEGRELAGIHFAMDFLIQSNRRVAGKKINEKDAISAKGKNVVVIGGGDTGSDCVGTSHRQGAKRVVQIEVMPAPTESRPPETPWPKYPLILKISTSHKEGGERQWSVLTKKFSGEGGLVKKVHCVKVDFSQRDANGTPIMREVKGSEFIIDADLVILAIGFLHPEHSIMLKELGVDFDQRGNVKTDVNYMTSVKSIFAAGDMRRGQSLIVWAISEGRRAAHNVDKFLMGKSSLPVM